MENLELWACVAVLWGTQLKLLFDMRELKQCIKIEKRMRIKQ